MPTIEISQESYNKLEGIRQKTEFSRRMWRPQNKEWEEVVVSFDDVVQRLLHDHEHLDEVKNARRT